MTDAQGAAAGEDPAAEPTDDELFAAAAGAEQEFPDEGDAIDLELDALAIAAERDDYRDALQRVKAEFDNYKKRVARDEVEVLDACDAAIGHGATDVEPIAKVLGELLEREGLLRLAPEGEPFDPNHHEAVMHEPGDGGEAIVVETLRTGYEWKGRVLRPAMVKVRG